MKRVLSFAVFILLLLTILPISAIAAKPPTMVFVTVADANGNLVVTQEGFAVTDRDGDGRLTVNDCLILAHDAKFTGGSSAGYGYANGEWGPYITKLWGNTEGNYGYYVNHTVASGLGQEVQNGDCVAAFVYTEIDDSMGYAMGKDKYCYFDRSTLTGIQGESVMLTLMSTGFDPVTFDPVTAPVKQATVTLNGVATACKTDDEGKVTLTLEQSGTVVISAFSETETLVPPVCLARMAPRETEGAADPTKPADAGGEILIDNGGVEKRGCGAGLTSSAAGAGVLISLACIWISLKREEA